MHIVTAFKSNDDILLLGLLCDAIHSYFSNSIRISCEVRYMMYQQDDRRFIQGESFGLKFICNILNSYPVSEWKIFHPHSDKIEFLNNCTIVPNDKFISAVLQKIPTDSIWIIPDAGAAKSQLKQIDRFAPTIDFEIASKTRDHVTGGLKQYINCTDFQGRPCIIFDDICLKGGTFIGLHDILKERNAGDIYLAVSHGVFNEGVGHLTSKFRNIFTTNSICNQSAENLLIYDLDWNPAYVYTSPWL
jgi:ribose-phosphate pyrophosphokinase